MVVACGGVAGAALETAIARAGVQVCIVEREIRFRDRTRGEVVYPWDVAPAALRRRMIGLPVHPAAAEIRRKQ